MCGASNFVSTTGFMKRSNVNGAYLYIKRDVLLVYHSILPALYSVQAAPGVSCPRTPITPSTSHHDIFPPKSG